MNCFQFKVPAHLLHILTIYIRNTMRVGKMIGKIADGGLRTLFSDFFFFQSPFSLFGLFGWSGFYLHSRVTVQIFNTEAPVVLFNLIGWGKLFQSDWLE